MIRDDWIVGVDVETTGLDPKVDVITELGFCIYDTTKNKPLHIVNVLLKWDESPAITPEIEAITGITEEMLDVFAGDIQQVFEAFVWATSRCSMIVAHNAPFDRAFIEAALTRLGLPIPETDWVDTSADIVFPQHWKGRNLTYLAAEHGFVNPFKHRAIFDTLTMLRMTDSYDMPEVLRRSKLPSFKFVADLMKPWKDPKPDGLKDTDRAKVLGFRFEKQGNGGQWTRTVKEDEVEALKAECKKQGIKGRVVGC